MQLIKEIFTEKKWKQKRTYPKKDNFFKIKNGGKIK